MVKLYHGTNVAFGQIDFAKSKPNKDFGPGFYLTSDKSQAEEMAATKVFQSGGQPVIQEYEFDEETFAASKLKSLYFEAYSKEWAEFIILNRDRSRKDKRHDYDFVYGPIADDRIGLQVQLFLQDYIDIDTLLRRIKYFRPTFQYYFGTQASLQYLKRI